MRPTRLTPLEADALARLGLCAGATAAEVRQRQGVLLREAVRRVKAKSPFYAQKLLRVEPETVAQDAKWSEVPFTTSSELARHGAMLPTVGQSWLSSATTVETSGSSGGPKRMFFTQDDLEATRRFYTVGMSTFVEAGRRVLILLPGGRPGSVGALLSEALQRIDVSPFVRGYLGDPAAALAFARENGVDTVVGLPREVVSLAVASKGALCIKDTLLSGDMVTDETVKTISEGLGCRVFDHYGMTEMGLGGAVQCEARKGLHVRESELYFEIVSPESGEVLPYGEWGEIVFTALFSQGMPLIRYRTGDLGRFLNAPCPCGSVLRALDRIGGRLDGSTKARRMNGNA